MKPITPNRKARKRILWSVAFGVLYTAGFFVAIRMMWVDLTDRYLFLESAISHAGQAMLYSLYAPVTFTPLWGSRLAVPFLFLFGFVGAWLIPLFRQHRRDERSHIA